MFNIIYCFLLALIIAAVRVGVAVFHLFRVLLCFWGRKTNEKAYIPGIYAICYRASHNFYHNADLSDALWLTPPGPAPDFAIQTNHQYWLVAVIRWNHEHPIRPDR